MNENNENNSCGINDKNSSCCSKPNEEAQNLGEYWCDIYTGTDESTLGWYEKESKPSLALIEQCHLDKNATIFNPGCGASTIIDSLLDLGYSNIIANDISSCALNKIKARIDKKENQVQWLVEDLTAPKALLDMPKLDLWHDRAVFHFFTAESDQNTYFDLLKDKVKSKGFVILAAFNREGATTCSGLPVKRYDSKMLTEKLGTDFQLIQEFDYIYIMPSGEKRPYIYTLFKRN